jgi:hypothetical protein
MSEKNPTLQDVWRLLGAMSRRFDGIDKRFDAVEREMVRLRSDVKGSIFALKESIEARDFRLDEHGRRLTDLERSQT